MQSRLLTHIMFSHHDDEFSSIYTLMVVYAPCSTGDV